MALNKLDVALFGALLCLQLSAARIISFHAPSSLPAIPRDNFRIVIPDASAPAYAALAAPSEPAPVREDQNDIPPPPRVLPAVQPRPAMVGLNPPAYAADAAAAFGFGYAPATIPSAPVTAAPPAGPTPPPGVVQIVNSVIPNMGARVVEPPPAIVPPPDAVNYVPLREQAQQLVAQGYNLNHYPSPGAALAPSAPRLSVPSRPQTQTYASNFAAFASSAIPAEGAPAPLAPAALTASFGAPIAPLVAASPLSRQTSVFGQGAQAANNEGVQITHHPGHGDGGATSYSSSSFTNKVQ